MSQTAEDIRQYRRGAFLGLGFSPAIADLLAESKIELESARKLHARGCPHDLITAILSDDPLCASE